MNPSSTASMPRVSTTADRAIEAPELIDRLAEQLRASSDVDLPHSYFVEQVRLGLAGKDLADRVAANDIESGAHRGKRTQPRSVFHAWAMPD
ncbi:hypothetical protein GVN24_23540 [Rhizobium sp. CRIBSB]|uniref:Uncharacterized protein n=1 Tax=Peteryoungia aggregata LMG 23059 TaxID=1368425 RepID=A0ABU0GER2_9HYPH|nr:hypothetical protein [Peteryoungia aggregata]MDQ0423201.1 hypothetical protein [Peteryoungia aggregata LMG 23059]NBB51260.1 hypothetical protein [Rhizobium sp. CRIBSB]